jgi:hypothetical protein
LFGFQFCDNRSVSQPLRRFRKLLFAALRVAAGGLKVFMPQDLSERNQVVAVVGQKLAGSNLPVLAPFF